MPGYFAAGSRVKIVGGR